MKRTKIAFDDIKAGDLIEAVAVINGIKYTGTGIAFEKAKTKQGDSEWQTSEGGTLTIEDDEDVIYRLDVRSAVFDDVQAGDNLLVTRVEGDTEITVRGRASVKLDGTFNPYWLTGYGKVLVSRLDKCAIEILEREGE